ncbi:MAG: hypothetical protein Q8O98_01430 [bacterium]|nr:hypothetical protein [bacterium]
MNIHEFELDDKGEVIRHPWLDKFFITLMILLVASLSFGVGRLSVSGEREGVSIEYDPQISNYSKETTSTNSQTASAINAVSNIQVVGSKNSDKYHYGHCPGAKQISEKNKVTFQTAQAAEEAGYTRAANCQPR